MLQKLQLNKLFSDGKKFLIYSTYSALGIVLFLLFFSQVILRFFLWPLVPSYLNQINQVVSQSLHADFKIGAIETSWRDFRPAFIIKNIKISNPDLSLNQKNKIGLTPGELLEVPQIEGIINWNSIWQLSPHFQYLSSHGAKIFISRDSSGIWNIAGFTLTPSNQDSQALAWIMSESNLQIGALLVEVNDQFEEAANFSARIETMTLKNEHFDHQFDLKLNSDDLNGNLMASGQFTHRFTGNKANLKNWQGHFNWSIENLDIKQLLDLTSIPARGKIGALEFRGEYDLFYGGLTKGSTYLNADDINFYWKNSKNNLLLKHLNTELKHRIEGDKQVISAKNFAWSTADTKNSDTSLTDIEFKFEIPNQGNQFTHLSIQAPYLKLEPINQLALSLPLPISWLKNLRELAIHGELKDLVAKYNHRPTGFEKLTSSISPLPHFELQGLLRQVGWNELATKLPGMQNLNGEIDVTETSGHISLDSPQLRIQAGHFMTTKNIEFDEAKGVIDWHQNKDKALDIQVDNVTLANRAFNLQGSIKYLLPPKGSNEKISLNMEIKNSQIPYLINLLPTVISADAIKYIQGTLIDGTLESGKFQIEGNPQEIPFNKESNSKFIINSQFKNLSFRPLPNRNDGRGEWLPLEKVNANLSIKNESLLVQIPSAQFRNTIAKNFEVAINLKNRPTKIDVNGTVNGKAADFVKYVLSSPIGYRYKDNFDSLDIIGDANLKLSITETIQASNPTNFLADLTLANNQIRFRDLPAGNLHNANIVIDQKGIKLVNILGDWLGGPLSIKTNNKIIEVVGNLDASKLMEVASIEIPALNKSVKNSVKGTLAYQSSFIKEASGFSNNTVLDFRQVQLDLPEPLIKPLGDPMLGTMKLTSNNNVMDWQFKLDNIIQSSGTIKDEVITKHALAIGNTALPQVEKGLRVHLDVASLNIDKWNLLLDKPKKIDSLEAAKSLSKEVPPVEINAKIKTLIVANKKITDLTLLASHNQNQWNTSISSPLAIGNFEWIDSSSSNPFGLLKAKFTKLTIPNSESKETIVKGIKNSSEQMPELDIQIDQLALGDKQFGALSVLATSKQNIWNLQKLHLQSPHGVVNATGKWQLKSNNVPSRTSLDFDITSNDTGELLASLGYAKVISNGKGDLSGSISWTGSPVAFTTKTLDGNLKFLVENGKVLQVDAGAAKLLGILSLQGLLKFATLNFSGSVGEVVSSGTSFDKVSANAVIKRGILETNDFEMMTTPAKISMSGLVNLNQETQDIRVIVYPRINLGSAGLAVLYFTNPIIGLGTMLGQYVLSSGVNKALQSDYLIQGNWQNPEVIPLDQNGKPIDPEAIKIIRQKSLLNDSPGKSQDGDISQKSLQKSP